MGMFDMLKLAPIITGPFHNTAQDCAIGSQYAQGVAAQQAQPVPNPIQILCKMFPLEVLARGAMDKLVRELPINVVVKINEVRACHHLDIGLYIEVRFINGAATNLVLDDTFPTDADIARVCLECP